MTGIGKHDLRSELKPLFALLSFVLFSLLFSGCAHQSDYSASPRQTVERSAGNPEAIPARPDDTAARPSQEPRAAQTDEDISFLEEEDEEEAETVQVADPILYWNKAMYHFNDKFYFWLLKPVAQGYQAVVPEVARIGVKNFFHNLMFPVRFAGCLLQAKGTEASAEFSRFAFNTTFGVLGFGDLAKNHPQLNPPEEDAGQAFGRWGIGNGFYIVWPFLGPSTLRDSVGLVGNHFLNPVSYVDSAAASAGITGYRVVNETSFRIGDYEALKKGAVDPYASIRNAYVTNRKKKVDK